MHMRIDLIDLIFVETLYQAVGDIFAWGMKCNATASMYNTPWNKSFNNELLLKLAFGSVSAITNKKSDSFHFKTCIFILYSE